MKKREFFLKAVNHESQPYCSKEWWLSILTECYYTDDNNSSKPYPFKVINNKAGQFAFFDPDQEQWVDIDGIYKDRPLILIQGVLRLKVGDLPNVFEDVVTTYGEAFHNLIKLIFPFGKKISYRTGLKDLSETSIESYIASRLKDDVPKDQETETDIYTHEYLLYGQAVGFTTGFNNYFVASVSPKSLTADPNQTKLRDKLLKEVKDSGRDINDPTVVAEVEAKLVANDVNWIDDYGKNYFVDKGHFETARKKVHSMHGYEKPFSDKSKGITITRSLSEGIDLNKLPEIANAIREGSHNRSVNTQLGGVDFKEANRSFQNTSVPEEDCGSINGLYKLINSKKLIGSYYLDKGKPVLIDEANYSSLEGKELLVRSPTECQTKDGNFCKVCVGKELARSSTATAAAVAGISADNLYIFMKKIHVSSTKVTELDLTQAFI